MASHRYWRVRLIANNGDQFAIISELEFRATAGGADQATGGVASQSSFNTGSQTGANCFDNNNSTFWACSSGAIHNAWVSYDFLSAVTVLEVGVRARGDVSSPTQAPRSFFVEGSDNNVDWTPYARVEGQTSWAQAELRLFAVSATSILPAASADANARRHWRLLINSINGAVNAAIAELQWRTISEVEIPFYGFIDRSSQNSGTQSVAFAFDKVPASAWISATNQQNGSWISVDFGNAQLPERVAITARADVSSPTQAVFDITVQRSSDGSAWEDVVRISGLTSWAQGETRSIVIPYISLLQDADLEWPISSGERLLQDSYLRWPMQVPLFNELQSVWPLGRQASPQERVLVAVNEAPELGWYVPREWALTASEVRPTLGFGAGAFTLPISILAPPDGLVSINRQFTGDFYFRIWVIPDSIRLQNPTIGAPVPFQIWSAYPFDNTLENVTYTGTGGVSVNFTTPLVFGPVQLLDTSFQVLPSAPINIEVTIGFDFTSGSGELAVSGQIAEFVQMVPDPPVTETLEWLTDVITTWGSKEQRLALRGSPRRNINYSFLLEGDDERRRQYNRWFKSLPRRIVLPYYQYGTLLLQNAAQGDSTLLLDTTRSDIRDGDNVIVYQPWNEVGYLVKVLTVAADRLNLELPLEQDVFQGSIVAPCFTSRLANRSGLSMGPISGSITIDAEALDARPQFTRPGASVTLETRNNYPILIHRPLAEGEVDDKFDANYEVIDNDTGLLDIKTAWPIPFVQGSREFLVQRYFEPASMDWWRAFLDYCRGRQNPFLLPSWRSDLVSVAPPGSTSAQLVVASADYPSRYFPYETYRYLQIENAAGQFLRRRVLSATDLGGGTCRLDLDGAFGSTAEELTITKVSFMNLVRLDSDKVTLEHDHHITRVKLSFKAINA